mgnify:CR=1 FL=1
MGVLEQNKPETSLKTKLTKQKWSYFGHIMRTQGSLEKTVILGKTESSRKRGKPNMRWTDSIKGAISMNIQGHSRAIRDRTLSITHS